MFRHIITNIAEILQKYDIFVIFDKNIDFYVSNCYHISMKRLGNKEIEMNKRQGKISIIIDILLIIISAPIILIAVIIIAKALIFPDKIPDVFSYKPFIILNEGLEKEIDFGDLAITKIVDTKELKVGDIIAYRFGERHITLHKIKSIKEMEDKLNFTVNSNLANGTESVIEDNVEGLYIKKIANVRNVVNSFK